MARRIVLGFDGSPGAEAALKWCLDYAPALDAEVTVVGVVDLVPFIGLPPGDSPLSGAAIETMHEATAETLEDAIAPLRERGIVCRALVQTGTPPEMLTRVAAEEGADLVVVGRRGRGGFAEMLLGSVPHALAHHCTRPLVIVPIDS
jgi:nucleotide-binding universal stress UspA family protein